MCEVPVFYATTHGQTRRIALALAAMLRAYGLTSEAFDIASDAAERVDWTGVRGALVGASLHAGRHQKAATAFVRAHRDHLNAHPSWFFSVSLGAASRNAAEVAEARHLATAFTETTGWHPRHIACFAGRLAYTQYGWLTRLVMRRIAGKEGGSTDTSRDYEYTDWAAVELLGRRCAIAITDETHARPAATTPTVGPHLTSVA